MDGIYETNDSFDFDKLNVISPTNIQGGNYFIKFRINDSPLYIQPPKCKTKQGILKGGKRMYCDFMFTNENESFIRWMENLENYCKKTIFENREKWFETDLDEEDIENSFTSPLKLFKSGKYYIIRTNVPTVLGKCSLKIYNEDEDEVAIDSIKENTNVVFILEIQGIKCSLRNFQIEFEVKQLMVMKPENLFEKCIFKKQKSSEPVKEVPEEKDERDKREEKEESEEKDESEEKEEREESEEKEPDNNNLEEDAIDNLETMVVSSEIEKKTNEPTNEIEEVIFDLDTLPETDSIQIKKRNDIYYEIYREAKRKAKIARDLAVSSYLEAKRIKNTYLLDDEDSESELDEDTFENIDESK
jgi:hypothetical protein